MANRTRSSRRVGRAGSPARSALDPSRTTSGNGDQSRAVDRLLGGTVMMNSPPGTTPGSIVVAHVRRQRLTTRVNSGATVAMEVAPDARASQVPLPALTWTSDPSREPRPASPALPNSACGARAPRFGSSGRRVGHVRPALPGSAQVVAALPEFGPAGPASRRAAQGRARLRLPPSVSPTVRSRCAPGPQSFAPSTRAARQGFVVSAPNPSAAAEFALPGSEARGGNPLGRRAA